MTVLGLGIGTTLVSVQFATWAANGWGPQDGVGESRLYRLRGALERGQTSY